MYNSLIRRVVFKMSKSLFYIQYFSYLRYFVSMLVLCMPFLFCSKTENMKSVSKIDVDSTFLIISEVDSIKIGWNDTAKSADSVSYYELYVRSQSMSSWQLLKNNITDSQVLLYRKEIVSTDSVFFFGIRSVAKNGKRSTIHTSSDRNASPSEWAVLWKKKG